MSGSREGTDTERILHHRHPSLRSRFMQPVVVKQGNLFLLCTNTGDIQADTDQGLYFHDMRYLSRQTLQIDDKPLVSLLADSQEGNRAIFELTNPDLSDGHGATAIPKEGLGIRREIELSDDVTQTITIRNFLATPVAIAVTLTFEADFADMFVVRGMPPGKRGTLHKPRWQGTALHARYDGADGHDRRTVLRFSQRPDRHDASMAAYTVHLQRDAVWELSVSYELRDAENGALEHRPHAAEGPSDDERQRATKGALGTGVRVETDNPLFNAVLSRSLLDLQMLRMRQAKQEFFAAGVPWYVALFGRDSLVTALQVAAFDPEIAANTLRVLARHQGTTVDDWRDEQPGKILHELRVDEMANLGELPQTPYFGSVDSTPKFLILLGVHAAWTGSLALFCELRENIEAALRWIEQYGDTDGDGFIDYQTRSSKGGRNQGWKDSGNGVVMEDGSLAEPPIALPEVQGDIYLAWLMIADMFERDGDAARAHGLRERATQLSTAFNDAFWVSRTNYYAFCRQADGRFSRSIASNPAHALWTGIVNSERTGQIVQRVLTPDMFSGWGVRTLSTEDTSYNPIDYQVGSVWPHDNAFIVAGMHRCGFHDEANQVFTAIFQAASRFEHFRLPELFAGYDRSGASRPVQYPVACSPQAWAAGSIPFMLTSILGLQPDGFNNLLRIVRPCLPEWLTWVKVEGLEVGAGSVDLSYQRIPDGTVVAVTARRGDLDVVIQPV